MNREDILKLLNSVADKKWAEDIYHKNIVNTKATILGVRTPEMRKLARSLSKQDNVINLLSDEFFEESMLHGFFLGYEKDIDKAYCMIMDFLPHIDNWAVCDQTCASMKVFKKDENNLYLDRFISLSLDFREFYARVGLIMLMTYYLKDDSIKKILDILPKIQNHSYYVDMAVAWLISFAFVKFREQTLKLIQSRTLCKFVQNKAICKCRDSFRVSMQDKEELKNYRIK